MKLLSILVLTGLMSTQVLARDSSDGCGLGWEVTDKKTLSATTTRLTTNVTIPPTFGMSTGTIGCEQHSLVKADKAPLHFAEINYEVIITEMAKGEGETLETFASVLGCDVAKATKLAQENYGKIVKAHGSADQLIRDFRTTSCL